MLPSNAKPGISGKSIVVVLVSLAIGCPSVTGNNGTSPPVYHTSYMDLPSPDWYLPVRSFMNMLSSSSLADLLITTVTNSTDSRYEMILNNLGQLDGILVFTVICCIFLLFIPPIGFIFCCCRLCNQCGGNYKQSVRSSQNKIRRYVMTAILVFVIMVSLVSLLYMYLSVPAKRTFISSYTSAVDGEFDDFNLFINYSKEQIEDLIDENIIHALDIQMHKLQYFSKNIGDEVYQYTCNNSNIEEVIKNLPNCVEDLTSIQTLLQNISTEINRTDSDIQVLKLKMIDLKKSLENFVSICNNSTTEGQTICKPVEEIMCHLDWNVDFISIDLSPNMDQLKIAANSNFTDKISNFNASFHDIVGLIKDSSTNVDKDIAQGLHDIRDFASDRKVNVDTFFNEMIDSISQAHKIFHMDDDIATALDSALFGVTLTIAVLLSVIWIVLTCGVVGGSVLFDSKVLPTERNGLSDTFGALLMAAVGLIFCLSGFLWIVTIFLSIPGSILHTIICRTLFDDQFTLLNSLPERGALILPTNSSFSLSSVLISCQNNTSAFHAFGLTDTIDMNDTLYIDLDDFRDSWNASDVYSWDLGLDKLGLNDSLYEFDNGMAVNFTSYLLEGNMLVDTQLRNMTGGLQSIMEILQTIPPTDILYASAEPLIDLIENLTALVTYFSNEFKAVATSINEWNHTTFKTREQVSAAVQSLPVISETVVIGAFTAVARYTAGFINSLASNVFNFISNLYNNVGNCWQIWVIFQSLRVTTCRNVVDSINAFWINMAVVLIFFLVAIIPAVKLSKYFRTMDHLSKNDQFQRQDIPRRPVKVLQATNGYFDDDNVPSTSPRAGHAPSVPHGNKIQPIIFAFDQMKLPRVLPPPDLLQGNACIVRPAGKPDSYSGKVVPQCDNAPVEAPIPAVRLSSEQLDTYQRIPRVSTTTPPPSVNYDYLQLIDKTSTKTENNYESTPPAAMKRRFSRLPSLPHDKN